MILAFVGENTHDRDRAAHDYINGFTSIHGDIAVDRFRGEDLTLDQLQDSITTAPFLTLKRLVIVRGFMANKLLADNIDSIVNNIADTTDLILIEDRLDARSKNTSNLKKLVDVREFTQLDSSDLNKWIINYVKNKGASIASEEANYLVDRVGTNQQMLSNELDKLCLYDKQITKNTIDRLTVYAPSSSIFAMLDALFNGNLNKASKLYDEQSQQGMEARGILGMIIWQLNTIAIVVAAGDIPTSEIVAKSKLSPFVVRKNQTIANKITKKRLLEIYEKTLATDRLIKTNKAKPNEAVVTLLAEIV